MKHSDKFKKSSHDVRLANKTLQQNIDQKEHSLLTYSMQQLVVAALVQRIHKRVEKVGPVTGSRMPGWYFCMFNELLDYIHSGRVDKSVQLIFVQTLCCGN